MTFATDGKKGGSQSVRVHLPPRTLQVSLLLLTLSAWQPCMAQQVSRLWWCRS